jgi:hypothetical protein
VERNFEEQNKINRRQFLQLSTSTGIVTGAVLYAEGAWAFRHFVPKEKSPEEFDEVDRILSQNYPSAKFVTTPEDIYTSEICQMFVFDEEESKVKEMIEEAHKKAQVVDEVGAKVEKLSYCTSKYLPWNDKRKLGVQKLSNIERGGVCWARAATLAFFMESVIPETQPRLLELRVGMSEVDGIFSLVRKRVIDESHVAVGYMQDNDLMINDPSSFRNRSFTPLEFAHFWDGIEVTRVVKTRLR